MYLILLLIVNDILRNPNKSQNMTMFSLKYNKEKNDILTNKQQHFITMLRNNKREHCCLLNTTKGNKMIIYSNYLVQIFISRGHFAFY